MKDSVFNNTNDFSKRTSAQVASILKRNDIAAKVDNTGDGRTFRVNISSSIKNRYTIKKAGFILLRGEEGDNYIGIKAY